MILSPNYSLILLLADSSPSSSSTPVSGCSSPNDSLPSENGLLPSAGGLSHEVGAAHLHINVYKARNE